MSERYEADGPNIWDCQRERYICSATPAGVDAETVAKRIAAALNAQAGVVEALRPLEVEIEKLDDATERDSTPEMVGATWRLIDAVRAALAAVKGVES